jgi:hypothetical protein
VPYIITTRHPRRTVWEGTRSKVVTEPPPTRVAVDTPDDARRAIIAIGEQRDTWIGGDALHGPIDRNGGTIGPLPDGTVIEVRQLQWIELARLCEMDCGNLCAGPNEDVLAVFNGAQA